MGTKSRVHLHRKVLHLGLVSATAVLLSACSSDADRLSFFGVDQAPAPYAQPQAAVAVQSQPLIQPAPYTTPTYGAVGYGNPAFPQTTASIGQPMVQSQPTFQAMPQPVFQSSPAPVMPRTPMNAPNMQLATLPDGMVGAQMPRSSQIQPTFQQPVYQQPTFQQPVYQQPTFQQGPQPLTTASIGGPRSVMADPVTTASIAPLGAPQQLPQPMTLPQANPQALPPSLAPQTTAQLPSQVNRAAGWSAIGGTRVRVQPGETLFSMSRRYGIPVAVLQTTNNLPESATLREGQEVIIPVFSAAGSSVAAAPAAPQTLGVDSTLTGSVPTQRPAMLRVPAPTPRPASIASMSPQLPLPSVAPQLAAVPAAGTHVVAQGETLYGIARRYQMPVGQLMSANNIADANSIRIGQRLVVGAGSGQALPPVASLSAIPQTGGQTSGQTPAQIVAARTYTPPQQATQVAAVEQTAAIREAAARNDAIAEQTPLQFRWPIRGRVLSTFGTSASGVRNDGVNIAVPEGASIRAAEDGEVVYAGNELRGFGNLVLIQHRGGYVTAYAHNSQITVRRGDRVSRGEIIARAGSTGDVDTPQLHFEIRRGTTPVDPGPYLPAS